MFPHPDLPLEKIVGDVACRHDVTTRHNTSQSAEIQVPKVICAIQRRPLRNTTLTFTVSTIKRKLHYYRISIIYL